MAKNLDTEPGSRYSVDSAAGCTVSTPAGQVICRVMPGILGSFEASTYVTVFSDESAVVRLVSSGSPGGTGGDVLTISQALAAANKAEAAAEDAKAAAGNVTAAAQAAQGHAEVAASSATAAEAARASALADAVRAETAEDNAEAAAGEARASAQQATAAAEEAEEYAALVTPEMVRPSVMLLVRDEIARMLGSAERVHVDTDGQKIVVHTDRLEDEQLAAVEDVLGRFVPGCFEVVRYNHHIEVSWRDIDKYAECTSIRAMLAVNPDYKKDLTSDGEWVYPLPELTIANSYNINGNAHADCMFADSDLQYIDLTLPKALHVNNIFVNCHKLRKARLVAPVATLTRDMFLWSKVLEEVEVYFEKTTLITSLLSATPVRKVKVYAPNVQHVDFGTVSKLAELEIYAPRMTEYSVGSSVLNKVSVIGLLQSLPVWGDGEAHSCVIGAAADVKDDEEVAGAIVEAEGKGWTMTVRWQPKGGEYVTPTSSTYGLRRQPIYARKGEVTMPDGTVEDVLEWGHYVTDPSGYEEFSSVEEACEFFGLPVGAAE